MIPSPSVAAGIRRERLDMDDTKPTSSPDDLKARALVLADLAQYQPGAVVSREVLRKKTGTVSVFAFDAGEELSEHTAPFDALVFALDGRADIVISGKVHRLEAGEMIIMPGGEPHALKAVERFKMALIMIRT
jgi:quercetin dioxygenase-like cupin family protein